MESAREASIRSLHEWAIFSYNSFNWFQINTKDLNVPKINGEKKKEDTHNWIAAVPSCLFFDGQFGIPEIGPITSHEPAPENGVPF